MNNYMIIYWLHPSSFKKLSWNLLFFRNQWGSHVARVGTLPIFPFTSHHWCMSKVTSPSRKRRSLPGGRYITPSVKENERKLMGKYALFFVFHFLDWTSKGNDASLVCKIWFTCNSRKKAANQLEIHVWRQNKLRKMNIAFQSNLMIQHLAKQTKIVVEHGSSWRNFQPQEVENQALAVGLTKIYKIWFSCFKQ